MNDVLRVIHERRSTRAFKSDAVSRELIEQVVEAGLYAPSAHNHQSWHFTVITNEEFLSHMNQVAKATARASESEFLQKIGNNEQYNVFYKAPVVIIVSGNESAFSPRLDTAAAAQNMLLAAESLDLGACWVGMLRLCINGPEGEKVVQKFELPEGYLPYFAVVLGHKAHAGGAAPRRKEGTVNYID